MGRISFPDRLNPVFSGRKPGIRLNSTSMKHTKLRWSLEWIGSNSLCPDPRSFGSGSRYVHAPPETSALSGRFHPALRFGRDRLPGDLLEDTVHLLGVLPQASGVEGVGHRQADRVAA